MIFFLAALFTLVGYGQVLATFPNDFQFGVANAPGQVEDKLDDIWLDWGHKNKIAGWKENHRPDSRLEFWDHPEVEIDLAKKLGVKIFRLGIDWGRMMTGPLTFDQASINHYRKILKKIKDEDMSVMLTLFHHSVPKWVQDENGWHNQKTQLHFLEFARKAMIEFSDLVDYWVTFNEANVFVMNAYTTGIWPPGEKAGPLSLINFGPIKGSSVKAMDLMAETHNLLFDWAHARFPSIKIGLAHNMAHYSSKSIFDRIQAWYANRLMNWRFPEITRGHLDFYGFNYYGAEWFKGDQIDLDPEEEYSEAGRAIDVNGLYNLLIEIHDKFPNLPIFITENGIADTTDALRGAYLIEHLLAVSEAIKKDVPVKGYVYWTLTDNLEWSDGYCPKFGLVDVNRKLMSREPRPSFHIFHNIILSKSIGEDQRNSEWGEVIKWQGKNRPFCRDEDGITAFGQPIMKPFSHKDWRFKK